MTHKFPFGACRPEIQDYLFGCSVAVGNMCLKMHLIVTVNHGPSCLLRLMAEGEASKANPGQAIYRTDRHSKANKTFIIMAFFP